MFERLMELLERGVVALEMIAQKDGGCKCPPAVASAPEDVNVYEPDVYYPENERPEVAEQAEADAAHLEREFLKSELRKKGVKFKESARTETLKKLLETTLMPNRVEEAPAEVIDPVTTEYTDTDVRAALTNLAAAKGKDVALNVLKSVGGAMAMKDVPADKYAAIVEACHAA